MIQTRKTYKKVGNDYIEDPNGFNVGYEWTDVDGLLRRTIYITSVDDLDNESTSAVCRYELLDPETNEWVLRRVNTALAVMTNYVTAQGVPVENPYEDDLNSPIYDESEPPVIIAYNQKLIDGLIPEFKFFYDLQMQLFNGIIQSIQVRKFGATGFN
jgi:hypothetical protein